MTPAELEARIDQGLSPPKPQKPNPVHHVSEALGCSDQHAVTQARARGLIDADNMLRCWQCKRVCDWHVSLHCGPCQDAHRAREPERQRAIREAERAERERSQDQSRPRSAGRSFRDEY